MPWTEETGGLQSLGMQKSETQLNDYTTDYTDGSTEISFRKRENLTVGATDNRILIRDDQSFQIHT